MDTSQSDLYQYFSKYGKVKHAYIIINHQTKKSKQFGYVEFFQEKDCDVCVKNAPHTINGQVIETERFIPKAIEKKNKKNVDKALIEEKLFELKGKEEEAKEKKNTSPERLKKAKS